MHKLRSQYIYKLTSISLLTTTTPKTAIILSESIAKQCNYSGICLKAIAVVMFIKLELSAFA